MIERNILDALNKCYFSKFKTTDNKKTVTIIKMVNIPIIVQIAESQ